MRGIAATANRRASRRSLIAGFFTLCDRADAMPAFAREYGVSCNVCHAAYPRLNDFGNRFAGDMNYRLANWREHTVETGDEMLALPKSLPLTDNISYYFYMIFAEKGANTEVIVEDAWFSYDDLFNSGVGL